MRILLFLLLASHLGGIRGKVALPIEWFLLQQPAFEVDTNSMDDSGSLPAIGSVPLVMRILFEEAEQVSDREVLPQGGDFHSLARAIRPAQIEELGLKRVDLNFPPLDPKDMKLGAEAWLVFQLRQSYILGNNCTQVLMVYENHQSAMKPVITVPLNYKTSEPLLVVNITASLRQWKLPSASYTVIIKDNTSYTSDQDLHSFANYIDCSLARTCEVLELHSQQTSPVLLLLSPDLAAKKLLSKQIRFRRNADYYTEPSTESKERKLDNGNDKYCRLQKWEVNIEQMGWDWLIYPERVPLNLCVGTCPILLDRHFNATSHAVARGLFRLVMGQESKPENPASCCVPVKYRQFTMLIERYDGTISLETSSDLSAAQCGCR